MALPTPTPPTSSAASPIRPMNWVSRSSQKRMPPPASASPRTPPAGIGKRGAQCARWPRRRTRPAAGAGGIPRSAGCPAAPGPIRPRASNGIISRGPRLAKALRPRSGSRAMTSRTSTVDVADPQPVAQRHVHAAAAPSPRPPRPRRRRAWPAHRPATRRPGARPCRRADRRARPPSAGPASAGRRA